MAEHRVRTTAAGRWLDKARGVADLRAEVLKRGLKATQDLAARAAMLAPPPRPGSKKARLAAAPPGGYVAAAVAAEALGEASSSAVAAQVCLPQAQASSEKSSGSDDAASLSDASENGSCSGSDGGIVVTARRALPCARSNSRMRCAQSRDSGSSDARGDDMLTSASSEEEAGFRRRPKSASATTRGRKKMGAAEMPATRDACKRKPALTDGLRSPALLSTSRLRRYELAALLIEDDVEVYRRQLMDRTLRLKTSSAQHLGLGAPHCASEAHPDRENPLSRRTVEQNLPSHAPVESDDELDIVDSTLALDDGVAHGMLRTLQGVFKHDKFVGERLRVDPSTLQVLPAPGLPPASSAGVDMTMQEWAVRRVLAGRNTLVVAATGVGKSLTYQLPAFILATGAISGLPEGITIVVSPLISLMRDQLLRLPRGLVGTCLSGRSTQGANDVASALMDLRDRRAHVLFVSPERLFSRAFIRLASGGGTQSLMPPVACVCVDEAHVVSEWSHNVCGDAREVCIVLSAYLARLCAVSPRVPSPPWTYKDRTATAMRTCSDCDSDAFCS